MNQNSSMNFEDCKIQRLVVKFPGTRWGIIHNKYSGPPATGVQRLMICIQAANQPMDRSAISSCIRIPGFEGIIGFGFPAKD